VNVAVLRLHDMDSTHLGVSHPFDIVRLFGLRLRIVILRAVQVQIVDQETLFLCGWSLGQSRVCGDTFLCLVIYKS
jgi:hypothetical protein